MQQTSLLQNYQQHSTLSQILQSIYLFFKTLLTKNQPQNLVQEQPTKIQSEKSNKNQAEDLQIIEDKIEQNKVENKVENNDELLKKFLQLSENLEKCFHYTKARSSYQFDDNCKSRILIYIFVHNLSIKLLQLLDTSESKNLIKTSVETVKKQLKSIASQNYSNPETIAKLCNVDQKQDTQRTPLESVLLNHYDSKKNNLDCKLNQIQQLNDESKKIQQLNDELNQIQQQYDDIKDKVTQSYINKKTKDLNKPLRINFLNDLKTKIPLLFNTNLISQYCVDGAETSDEATVGDQIDNKTAGFNKDRITFQNVIDFIKNQYNEYQFQALENDVAVELCAEEEKFDQLLFDLEKQIESKKYIQNDSEEEKADITKLTEEKIQYLKNIKIHTHLAKDFLDNSLEIDISSLQNSKQPLLQNNQDVANLSNAALDLINFGKDRGCNILQSSVKEPVSIF